MPQDEFQREERRLIVALGFLAAVITIRPLAAGVVIFFIKLDVLIDWLLIPPWLIYALFMWLWFSDDLFKRGRTLFHLLGLSALAVQILTILLLFGVTAIVVYVPSSLDPYLLDGYVVLVALWMGSALQRIVRAEGLEEIGDKAWNESVERVIVGRESVGRLVVRMWRRLSNRWKPVTGPENSRLAVRILLLVIEMAALGIAYGLARLPILALFYVPAFALFLVLLVFYLIGRSQPKGEFTVKTQADTSSMLSMGQSSKMKIEKVRKRRLHHFLFLVMAVAVSFAISSFIIIGIVLTIGPGAWLRTFRLVGLVFNIAGAFASLVPRAIREGDEIEAQSEAVIGSNPLVRTSTLRDTRVAQFGIALLAVGFFLQLIGNLG